MQTEEVLKVEPHDGKPIVISSADTSWRRCKHCGKFISYEQMQCYKPF
jgi:hypothetical protein